LIKKVAFRISILPLVRVLAALLVNLILMVIMLLMFVLFGYPIQIYSLQIIYYLAAGLILAASISLITSTIAVFIKDVRQAVTIFMQFCFWLTAVFWPINILPAK
jgi:ABC-type polysaccharide/polyol phosphate export permease